MVGERRYIFPRVHSSLVVILASLSNVPLHNVLLLTLDK